MCLRICYLSCLKYIHSYMYQGAMLLFFSLTHVLVSLPLFQGNSQARHISLQSSAYAVDYLCSQNPSVMPIVVGLVAGFVIAVLAVAPVVEDLPDVGLFAASLALICCFSSRDLSRLYSCDKESTVWRYVLEVRWSCELFMTKQSGA